jgi:quinol-cytochrome oxidoreductase complex cytochrome b subunit
MISTRVRNDVNFDPGAWRGHHLRRRPIDSKLGGMLAIFGAVSILYFVPWIDPSTARSAVYRPWCRRLFWLFAANVILAW